ncbi:MAG: type II toxin-antitoxin system Phd/YefM family antitoxin [Nitrosomonadales bacterium]|nr:type II toxin-antitoxin system Phd/YefM family antitoxin [Nitrosomonadales bacterium]
MKTATATEVKTKFGEYLDIAQKEPVLIEKSGRNVAVMVSMEEYKLLQALEDRYWGERALKARKRGMVGHDEAMKTIMGRLNAET